MTSGLPKKSIFREKPRVVKNLKFYSRIIPEMSGTERKVMERI